MWIWSVMLLECFDPVLRSEESLFIWNLKVGSMFCLAMSHSSSRPSTGQCVSGDREYRDSKEN